jgi:hypothetical protein
VGEMEYKLLVFTHELSVSFGTDSEWSPTVKVTLKAAVDCVLLSAALVGSGRKIRQNKINKRHLFIIS